MTEFAYTDLLPKVPGGEPTPYRLITTDGIDTVEAAERWQKVLDVLNSGEMPPEDRPPPDDTAKAEVLAVLSRATPGLVHMAVSRGEAKRNRRRRETT